MRLRVIDRGLVSPTLSQAIWHGIAAGMRPNDDPVLTLVNPAEPYVCIGFHQDALLEVDEDYCRSRGIGVLRRRLGGGAVYLDQDQLIFHFIFPRRRAPGRTSDLYPRFIAPVVRTYRALGIRAAYRPVNDIQVDGRKIGGTAAAILDEATVLGGMFLFDFDTATMARCLKVPSEKFRDKLHKTLAEYMTSMRRLLPEVPSRERVKSLFLCEVADCLGVTPEDSATTEAEEAAIADEVACLGDPAWAARVGRRLVPQGVKLAAETFLTEGAYKAAGGLIRVRLLAHEERIADIEISGDFTCNPAAGIAALAERLKGEPLSTPTLVDRIAAAMGGLHLDLPGVTPRDLAAAIEGSRHRDP
jgi:lipoate-protein ligase A